MVAQSNQSQTGRILEDEKMDDIGTLRFAAESTEYCVTCATRILASWQGWPHKDVVPLLPRLESGYCESCGGSAPLNSERITWYNYHGQYNTGLPDYWLLKIEGERTKWGLPYYAEGACPKCRSHTIISEMKYPNGKHELMHNCKECGLRKVRANQAAV